MKTLKQSLNPAFLKQKPSPSEIDVFKRELAKLLGNINPKESEEFHKNLLKDFLNTATPPAPANDNNQLNKEFYAELLHIIGLKEETKDGRKLIERANNTGSLIEEAISQIETDECKALSDLQYGEKHERAYNAAFRLVIIWINRILFLKLLEAQICKYHKGYKSYVFLSTDKLENYGDLNELFFSVLAVKTHERKPEHLKSTFANVPYLNSSLFEKADIEKDAIYIRALGNITHFTPYSKSVLHNENPPKSHLEYLLRFLDAYDFSSEGSGNVQEENKPLISASVLG